MVFMRSKLPRITGFCGNPLTRLRAAPGAANAWLRVERGIPGPRARLLGHPRARIAVASRRCGPSANRTQPNIVIASHTKNAAFAATSAAPTLCGSVGSRPRPRDTRRPETTPTRRSAVSTRGTPKSSRQGPRPPAAVLDGIVESGGWLTPPSSPQTALPGDPATVRRHAAEDLGAASAGRIAGAR